MFRSEKEVAEYFNPVTKKKDVVEVEIRFDPLTGKTHIQVTASKYLLGYQERIIKSAKEFYEKNGAIFR
uniref:Uncharacterized protein n=1 Tax=Geoglobus ahangari TaxID=113653 RepID=A0A7C3YLJ0_9EURY